jgi:hypothetical protein
MAMNEHFRSAARVAGWGAESGIIVTLAGVVPVLFLGTFVIEDFAAAAMLVAYGLLFGHYLARRLPAEGAVAAGHSRLLRLAPPVAMCAGYLGMRLLMNVSEATALSAIDGLVFGGLAGLILGVALQRVVPAGSAGAVGASAVTVVGTTLIAGAIMGLVAGLALTVPLGWSVAIPIWQAGMGAIVGFFLLRSPQPS